MRFIPPLFIHTLRIHYAHAAANQSCRYSKNAKKCIISVQLHSEHVAQFRRTCERRVGLNHAHVRLINLMHGLLFPVGDIQ